MDVTLDKSIGLEDVAAALAFVVAFCVALRGLWEVSRQLRDLTYGDLDRLYFDLQRAGLDYPAASLPPPAGRKDERALEDRLRYDIYAGMVWNLVETVDDRCRRDPNLKRTWFPVLEVEKKRHEAWIRKGQNADLFKTSFRERHSSPPPLE
jgi:hypothetical protein